MKYKFLKIERNIHEYNRILFCLALFLVAIIMLIEVYFLLIIIFILVSTIYFIEICYLLYTKKLKIIKKRNKNERK